jgi:tRNA isopentenyl-2-thiomethyl-A-37 hydroxylase MiaE
MHRSFGWSVVVRAYFLAVAAERFALLAKFLNGAMNLCFGSSSCKGEPMEYQKMCYHSICGTWVWHDSLSKTVQARLMVSISLSNLLASLFHSLLVLLI